MSDDWIVLSLLGPDQVRFFLDRRGLALHALDVVEALALRFRNFDPAHRSTPDHEHAAVIVSGQSLPKIGLTPTKLPSDRTYAIWRAGIWRESPVPYRMRISGIMVSTQCADQLELDLRQLQGDTQGFVTALSELTAGRYEQDKPSLSHTWQPRPADGDVIITKPMSVFLFLHVNSLDRPGGAELLSCWHRIDDAQIIDEGVQTAQGMHTSFNTLWPFFNTT